MGNEAIALGIGALYLLSKGLVNGNGKPTSTEEEVEERNEKVCEELKQRRDEEITFAERECDNNGGYYYFDTTPGSCSGFTSKCVVCPPGYSHDRAGEKCVLDVGEGIIKDEPPIKPPKECPANCVEDFYSGECDCPKEQEPEPTPATPSSCPNRCLEVAGGCYCHEPEPQEPSSPFTPEPQYPGSDDPYDIDQPVNTPSPPSSNIIYPGDDLYD